MNNNEVVAHRVLDALRTLPAGGRYLLAVSGGADSCALLAGFQELKGSHDMTCEIAHVDHKLREGSGDDCEFVRRWCGKLGLPFHLLEADPCPEGRNLEEYGRVTRYTYFTRLTAELGLDGCVTAHTADDLAETYLMRVLSNKDARTMSRIELQRKLYRPFLELRRAQLREYLELRGVEFREDPSNADTRFLRNRIRHKALPLLAELVGHDVIESLANRAQIAQCDFEGLDSVLRTALDPLRDTGIEEEDFGSRAWTRAFRVKLHEVPSVWHWRMVEEALLDRVEFRVGRTPALRALAVLTGRAQACELPGGWRLELGGGGVRLTRPNR